MSQCFGCPFCLCSEYADDIMIELREIDPSQVTGEIFAIVNGKNNLSNVELDGVFSCESEYTYQGGDICDHLGCYLADSVDLSVRLLLACRERPGTWFRILPFSTCRRTAKDSDSTLNVECVSDWNEPINRRRTRRSVSLLNKPVSSFSASTILSSYSIADQVPDNDNLILFRSTCSQ